MTKSRQSADYAAGGFYAGKNKIINGDFSVNQRGFTSTTTADTFGFDRWKLSYSGGTATMSAQTFTAGAAPVAGYEGKNYLRMVTSGQSATTDYAYFSQRIEDVRTFAGQTVTVSFWAKASTGTPKIGVSVEQVVGSGGTGGSTNAVGDITISSSWARYTKTIAIPSLSGATVGTGSNLIWEFWTSCGSAYPTYSSIGVQNVTIDVWGFQLEAGSTATAFQTATGTIQGELAACQRYYWRATAPTNAYSGFGIGTGSSSTIATILCNNPVPMRVPATAVDYSTIAVYDAGSVIVAVSSLTLFLCDPTISGLTITVGSGLTQYRPYILISNASTSGYIGFSAEL